MVEEDVPGWLWRHEPDDSALARLPAAERHRGETSAAEVVDRVAGCWTYYGWKGGYFDSEQDARAFFDEIRWLLSHGRCSPDIAQWQTTGLYCAYGLTTDDSSGFVTDFRSGAVRRMEAGDTPPHGMAIHGVHGAFSGEGGGLDLLRREAELTACGAQSGANISDVSADALPDFIAMGEAASRCSDDALYAGHAPRRYTVDGSHPAASKIAVQRMASAALNELVDTGFALASRHVQAILDACAAPHGRQAFDPARNSALMFALRSARQAMVPESTIRRTLDLAQQGHACCAADVISPVRMPTEGKHEARGDAIVAIRVDDRTMQEDSTLFDAVARAAWAAGNIGLEFADSIDAANPAGASGSIRSSSGDGSYLFLDDTAAEADILNTAAFLRHDGTFDIEGFRHAARLMTLAMDISLIFCALPSPRMARRVWDFRPLSLSLSGVGELLMARGISYDSDEGRKLCSGLCALASGAAWLASRDIADELGPCPAHAANAAGMAKILSERRTTVRALAAAIPSDLVAAAAVLWDEIADTAGSCSFRNTYLTAVCPATQQNAVVGCAARGVAPLPSLIHREPIAGGGYCRTIAPAVPSGLRALGYSEASIDAIVQHVVGRRTLAHAPGVNHETLRRRGFSEAALTTVEHALSEVDHIADAFNRWVLGDTLCRRMLGFTDAELADDDFDMLAALGFSDAGIEAANVYCCGADTMEGAPYLRPEHLPVFDCAAPQGVRGRRRVPASGIVRMMAAAQPYVCGGIGHAVTLPETATIDDCRALLQLGWHLQLKSLVIAGRETDPVEAAHRPEEPVRHAAGSALTLVDSSVSSIRSVEAEAAAQLFSDAPASHETVIASDGQPVECDAATSRRAISLAARGTASVPSSADAVVEQRQV